MSLPSQVRRSPRWTPEESVLAVAYRLHGLQYETIAQKLQMAILHTDRDYNSDVVKKRFERLAIINIAKDQEKRERAIALIKDWLPDVSPGFFDALPEPQQVEIRDLLQAYDSSWPTPEPEQV